MKSGQLTKVIIKISNFYWTGA